MDTDIDRVDISLLQMSDSFFPTGLYATSNGLESLSQIKKLKRKDISIFYENGRGDPKCFCEVR